MNIQVMEEVGFDMKDRASEDHYLERDFNGQLIRLYIVPQVPLDTNFVPKTKNEIKVCHSAKVIFICECITLNIIKKPLDLFIIFSR